METKILNGYKIDFYSEEEWFNGYQSSIYTNLWIIPALQEEDYKRKLNDSIQYAGLVSDISEELAEKIVDSYSIPNEKDFMRYDNQEFCDTAKESFQTLSDLSYCVIHKI